MTAEDQHQDCPAVKGQSDSKASEQDTEPTSLFSSVASSAADVVAGAFAGVGKAVEDLNKTDDSQIGPYESPATCMPSEFDPIAGAVHGGLELKEERGQRKDSVQDENAKLVEGNEKR